MAAETKTPDQMNLVEVIESIIESAKIGSSEKVDQLMSHFNSKAENTGKAALRAATALVESNKNTLGKTVFGNMLEKINACM